MWGKGELHRGLWWKDLRKGENLGYPGVDGRIILKRIFEKCEKGLYWTDVTQDRDRRRALVHEAMNLRVPYNVKNFLTS